MRAEASTLKRRQSASRLSGAPGKALAGELQRIDHRRSPIDPGPAEPGELAVQERDVEGRVVDHQLGRRRAVPALVQEREKILDHLGEPRLLAEEGSGQAVHQLRIGRHVALGVEVAVEEAAGRQVVDQLDRADLDQPVAVARLEPGGLGVDHDLAHAVLAGCA